MNRSRQGKVVTFYSFKGGVGRTMALANVAFLAAMNGKKVLVMDWDLEAPGLAYYFRGLLEAPDVRTLRDAPGVLDLAWEWSIAAQGATTLEQGNALVHRYENGEPFVRCIRSLAKDHLPEKASLDFIGVGAPRISAADGLPYEDALAHLSWADLMERDGGGLMLNALRNWAKRKYDLILLDSRTGLADVSGICTVQLPDTVALCFILNRQNMDGIARVAASIRTKREDAVTLCAVPMRLTSSRETFEGSDAQAHAIRELTRIGGFSRVAVQEHFQSLAVATADTVPFYETLAPFVSSDPSLDPLTLNYLRLASQLLGEELTVPKFPQEWGMQVRRRLQPRHATLDYLEKLEDAESSRAVEEVLRLIESASESDPEELDEEYIGALIKASYNIADSADMEHDQVIHSRALDLLRNLTAQSGEKWSPLLVNAINEYVSIAFLDDVDELALREEMDALLALRPTHAAQLQRLENWRAMGWRCVWDDNLVAARQILGDARAVANALERQSDALAADQREALSMSVIDLHRLNGDILLHERNEDLAAEELLTAAAKIKSWTPSAASAQQRRIASDIHRELARLSLPNIAAQHAVEAARWGGAHAPSGHFFELAKAIIAAGDPALATSFCEYALGPVGSRPSYGLALGRTPGSITNFIDVAIDLASIIAAANGEAELALTRIAQSADWLCQAIFRRKQAPDAKLLEKLGCRAAELVSMLESSGVRAEEYGSLIKLANEHRAVRKRVGHGRRALDEGDSFDE